MFSTRRTFLLSSLTAIAAPSAFAQAASSFPSRPVVLIVPYPAGGAGDTLARVLATKMAVGLGQPVVVDNRPGAAGQIGVNAAKMAPADGHTVLYGDVGPFAMNAALYPKLSYDVLTDFVPVTRLLAGASLVVVPANSRVNTMADLVALARGPKVVNYGSYGVGSQPHIWMEMFRNETRGSFNHVPYRGAAPAVQDLMGGQIDVMMDVASNSIPLVREGKLKALAVVGPDKRLQQLPNVPTIAEAGWPSLNLPGWSGMLVRAGTPPATVARLHDEIVRALTSADVVQRYADTGASPAPLAPAQFGEFMRTEHKRWGEAIRRAGVTLE